MPLGQGWYPWGMKLMKTAVLAGLAKKAIDEGRKPHNQAKIREAVAKAKQKRRGRP